MFAIPRELVRRVVREAAPVPVSAPDVEQARARLEAGAPLEAVNLARRALQRDPRSLAALHVLAAASLAVGDPRSAAEAASKALGLEPGDARAHALLGDARAAQGDRAGAELSYRRALELRPDPELERKLGDVAPAPARARGAQLRLRYDGGVNEPLGNEVQRILGDAWAEFSQRLAVEPTEPVTVVLEAEEAWADERVPEWAAAVNESDAIRVPTRGVSRPSPAMARLLRHELGHSFVTARTGGNCPSWLQEGVSQWLEGGDPGREDVRLARLLRGGKLGAILRLEGPFRALDESEAQVAYAQSLSAVAHVLRLVGEEGLVRLLATLGDQVPAEEALPGVLRLSYAEFQRSWEAHLRSLGTPSAAPRGR
ncbi:MAG: peptidase MA family metallohydrolase [Vicinamibacteria bacterium]|nr:peptidase MA family metallohydrolase [Vicinamibacteria bacterium]